MNKERIFNVLLAPHVSEKATLVADQGNAFVRTKAGVSVEALVRIVDR